MISSTLYTMKSPASKSYFFLSANILRAFKYSIISSYESNKPFLFNEMFLNSGILFDMTSFKKKEPQLYDDLFKDYQKTSTRKGYLKVTVI